MRAAGPWKNAPSSGKAFPNLPRGNVRCSREQTSYCGAEKEARRQNCVPDEEKGPGRHARARASLICQQWK